MPVYFGHRTAELLLEKQQIERLTPSNCQELEHCWANKSDLEGLDLSLLEDIPRPYHVLVSSPDELRSCDLVHCHLCQTHLPAGSFIEIAQDVFVASPALCLMQRAQELTLAQTVVLGERYCGTFALDPHRKSGIRKRAPLLTLDDLQTFIDHCGRAKGKARVRRAASLMLEKSASPMETVTRIVFCFPRRLSGFGLLLPQMNYEKTLNQRARLLVNKGHIVIDLYWKDYDFGIEYQGKYAHSSLSSISSDIARQLAAECMGIELQMLTVEQLRQPAQRIAIADKIAKRIGATISMDEGLLRDNQRLVDELLQGLGT